MDQEEPQPNANPQPNPENVVESSGHQPQRRNRPVTLDDVYREMIRNHEEETQCHQRIEAGPNEMMMLMLQMQRDQHDHAYWNDQSIVNLTEEMHCLTYRV